MNNEKDVSNHKTGNTDSATNNSNCVEDAEGRFLQKEDAKLRKYCIGNNGFFSNVNKSATMNSVLVLSKTKKYNDIVTMLKHLDIACNNVFLLTANAEGVWSKVNVEEGLTSLTSSLGMFIFKIRPSM